MSLSIQNYHHLSYNEQGQNFLLNKRDKIQILQICNHKQMGSSESKGKQIKASINHPKFTSAQFVANDKSRSIETSLGVEEKDYDSWKQSCLKYKLNSEYLLLPIKDSFSTQGLCGSAGVLKLQFQDYPYLLTEEIYNRKGKKDKFSEQELWYLLYAISSAKKDMKPEGAKIGDVRPQNIFLNDEGKIKIVNIHSWPRELSNYQKSFEGQPTYLAPEQLGELEVGKIENDKNARSEMFSLGLTVLSAASLQDFSSLYDLKDFKFDTKDLNNSLDDFRRDRAYSSIFKATVINLLRYDYPDRLTHQEIWEWTKPHEKNILAKDNFVFPSAPSKIERQFAQLQDFLSSHQTRASNIPVQGMVTPLQGMVTSQTSPYDPNMHLRPMRHNMEFESIDRRQLQPMMPSSQVPNYRKNPEISPLLNKFQTRQVGSVIFVANQLP